MKDKETIEKELPRITAISIKVDDEWYKISHPSRFLNGTHVDLAKIFRVIGEPNQ